MREQEEREQDREVRSREREIEQREVWTFLYKKSKYV
jgi:hypothetical protein